MAIAKAPALRGQRRSPRAASVHAIGLATLAALVPGASAAMPPAARDPGVAVEVAGPDTRPPRRAEFGQVPASPEVRHVAHWALDSGDANALPFIVIDKVNARVFVFDADGRLQGAEPALLGMGRGDVTPEGVAGQRLAAIRPQDRTTPAGRYVAALDRDLKGEEILWIDYEEALALHRVVKGQPSERRAERLRSDTPADNRISYGCINVPVPFYETVVSPAFRGTGGIVYILPETGPARELFGSYEIGPAPGGATSVQDL